jgi:DNA-binding SARP family transcriptional activator
MQHAALIQQETIMIPGQNDAHMIARPAQDSSYVNVWLLPPVLRIHLLGTFMLVSDHTPVTGIDMPRLQSLLAYLVFHHNLPQSRTRLASLLWPDSTEEQAHTNLRNLLYKLRQAMPQADRWLTVDRYTLMWQGDGSWVLDVLDFERAVARVEQVEQENDLATLRLALEQAVELYHGELLPGCYDEWILSERERLSQLFLNLLERLLCLREQDGDYAGAIRIAQLLLREDPLQEASYRHLMRLYAESGNRSAAIRTYQNCVAVLKRELAVEPGPETRQVYEQLIHSEQLRPYPIIKRSENGLETLYALHSNQYSLCEC